MGLIFAESVMSSFHESHFTWDMNYRLFSCIQSKITRYTNTKFTSRVFFSLVYNVYFQTTSLSVQKVNLVGFCSSTVRRCLRKVNFTTTTTHYAMYTNWTKGYCATDNYLMIDYIFFQSNWYTVIFKDLFSKSKVQNCWSWVWIPTNQIIFHFACSCIRYQIYGIFFCNFTFE